MMFDGQDYSNRAYKEKCKRRKMKLKYWTDKGCSYWKAVKLIERYGY